MLLRALPRSLDLCWVRSTGILTLTGRREVIHSLKYPSGHLRSQSGQRYLSSGVMLGCKDSEGYANDPQVKEWLKELQKDFSHQPQKEEEEKDVMNDKTKEGKERIEGKESVEGKDEKVIEEGRIQTGRYSQKGVLWCIFMILCL